MVERVTLARARACHRSGRLLEAVQLYREAFADGTADAQGWYLLGAAYQGLGRLDEAAEALRQALALQPRHVQAHNHLGVTLAESGQLDEALGCFRRALQLCPDYAEAYNNMGQALAARDCPEEALDCYRECLRLRPDFALAHANRGIALRRLGRYEESATSLGEALRLSPDCADAHFSLAATLLAMGDFARGWAEYAWRWRTKEFPGRPFPQPWWDGSSLVGRTLLLHAEQGLGDTLQFIRYVPLVKQRGGTVVVECPDALRRLMMSCAGVDRLVVQRAPLPPFDVHLPLLSLPQIFGTTLQTIPAEVPYLHADAEAVDRWRRELGDEGLKVGIVWQGAPTHRADCRRSVPLARFAPLAAVPGVRLFSLQKGAGSEQLADAPFPITGLGERLQDFVDTAALLEALDLVVTVDTAVAHLAGALGVPGWVALPFAPDWRWLLKRADSPWYPSLRLFRQSQRGDWDTVFGQLAAALRDHKARSNAPSSPQSVCADRTAFRQARRRHQEGDPAGALPLYRQALAADPGDAQAWYLLGAACERLDQLEEAIAAFRRALAIEPERGHASNHLGLTLVQTGQFAEAEASFRRAVQLWSADAEVRHNLSLLLLLTGRFAEGWTEYEWRWQGTGRPRRAFPQPAWDGEPLNGRTILLHAEQGFGDTLQFVRYAPLVKQRGGTVVLECQPPLVSLLGRCPGVDRVVARGATLPAFDVHLPLLSLPRVFGTTLPTIPAEVPYLHADTAAVERWRRELGDNGFKVGIVWQGNPGHNNDRRRSVALTRFASLAVVPGVRLFSLQKGTGSTQLAGAPFPLAALGERLEDFADTAAVLGALDLVITVDTALAHLAGGMGVPAWVALPFVPDWRWLQGRDDSPWYPSLRLFRQPQRGDWETVFVRLADALRASAAAKLTKSAALPDAQGAARTQNRLGIALQQQGKLPEAEAAFRQAVRACPTYALAHNNLGNILTEQGRLDEALTCYREAVRLQPDHPDALCNLGLALAARDQLNEALVCYRICQCQRPEHAPAYSNEGHALYNLGRYAESAASFQEALRLRPDDAEAHYSRGLSLLMLGDFAEGWAEYEWRWRIPEFPGRRLPQPRWNGEPLQGRTILLHAEQGLGDTIQFVRYASLVKQRGGRVMLECQPALRRLLESCPGVDRLVACGEPLPPFDVHLPLLSLPRVLGMTLETLPAQVPYLQAEPARLERWRQRLGLEGLKVGIAWQGSTTHKGDRLRSVALTRFAPLAAVPGVRLFSLQMGAGQEQLAACSHLGIVDLGEELDRDGAFLDTAAVMRQLDLVITIDTAVAHLAGALGVPAWVALTFAPDWRWLQDRADSPWYPTLRLFRQQRPGDWEGVFQRLRDALRVKVGLPACSIEIEVSPGELIDRIALLEIEQARSSAAAMGAELAILQAVRARLPSGVELERLTAALVAENAALRELDDALGRCTDADAEMDFTALARSVYDHNERRAALKREIDRLLASARHGT